MVVNILTNLAYHKKETSVFGGDQRAKYTLHDMVRAYISLIEDEKLVSGQIFNAGFDQTVKQHVISQKSDWR